MNCLFAVNGIQNAARSLGLICTFISAFLLCCAAATPLRGADRRRGLMLSSAGDGVGQRSLKYVHAFFDKRIARGQRNEEADNVAVGSAR